MAVVQDGVQCYDLMSEACKVAIPNALQSYAYILPKSSITHTLNTLL